MTDNNNIRVVRCTKEPFDVYIGRRPSRFVIKYMKGPCGPPYKWGNPFEMDKKNKDGTIERRDGTREEVLIKFRKWLESKEEVIIKRHGRSVSNREYLKDLHELRGKILGCYCKPLPCHGDEIKEFLERRESLKGEEGEVR